MEAGFDSVRCTDCGAGAEFPEKQKERPCLLRKFRRISLPCFQGWTRRASAHRPPAPIKSARSANRAAWWQQDLDRTAAYLMGQARTEDERAFVEQLYEQAVEEGPDFRSKRGSFTQRYVTR